MSVTVKLDELLDAHEWLSAAEAAAVDAEAFVSKATGKVHWRGEDVDEELPEDIEDATLYVPVPHKSDFDLGRSLALRFAEERMPREVDTVVDYFRKRGAYSKFKSLLSRLDQLDAWHEYEDAAVERALADWCADNGFRLVR